MKFIYTYLLAVTVLFFSCAPTIYQAPDFDKVTRRHKTVAILPSAVSINLRPNQAKIITPEQLKEEEKNTGYNIQNSMYAWFLKRSDKYNFTVRFQDITKTNNLVKEAGIEYKDIVSKDRTELAKLLGVDAVLQNHTFMDKPMSEGAALALGAIIGFWGTTNQIRTDIEIHDAITGDLLWKYNYQASGSIGSSSDQLVSILMRNSSRRFPYQERK